MTTRGFGGVGLVIGLGVMIVAGVAAYMLIPVSAEDAMLDAEMIQNDNIVMSEEVNGAPAELPMNDADAAGGTMMADDPRLETMSDDELAADGGADPLPLPDTGADMADTNDEMEAEVSDPLPTVAGTYQPYSSEKLALAENGRVLLFFHADWCPSCRALESDIEANLSDIPADVHILHVDYDTATELKQQYGIVRQHTLVHVDASGNEVKTLTGLTNTLEQVVAQI